MYFFLASFLPRNDSRSGGWQKYQAKINTSHRIIFHIMQNRVTKILLMLISHLLGQDKDMPIWTANHRKVELKVWTHFQSQNIYQESFRPSIKINMEMLPWITASKLALSSSVAFVTFVSAADEKQHKCGELRQWALIPLDCLSYDSARNCRILSEGMAKEMPAVTFSVLIPMTSPS